MIQVPLAVDVVNHQFRKRIEKQPVDRKVAPLGVQLGRSERHMVRTPAIAVAALLAKHGHVDLTGPTRPQHHDHAKGRADCQSASSAKDLANFVRRGVGGDVVIFRPQAQEFVPHAAARPQRRETRVAQLLHHAHGELALSLRIQLIHDADGVEIRPAEV